MLNITFRCKDELKAALEKLAKAENRSLSNWIVTVLEAEIERRTSRKK